MMTDYLTGDWFDSLPDSLLLLIFNKIGDVKALGRCCAVSRSCVTHHSPTQVFENFNEIKFLNIELPSGELGIEDEVLLRWRADFGSTLHNCVMLGASTVNYVDKRSSSTNQINSN
ncbi:putative F-box-like domain superfamily protein [Helianthus annuus]|uniref:F-box-like domain superfamily protein n=1 Tax=Helianthus annuus TaxID=4232 RepID=A0A9K3E2A0_HELAN|nr:putative F-box-like domain superfamily protein [Helianthus annuus]KAJ0831441.1 putative F-box-like domain superfamily protein [Helianthus annuus]